MKVIKTHFKPNVIQLGISACVVGQAVRFDGGHKRLNFADRDLRSYVQFVPICPEMAIGLGVPRPTIRQVADNERIRIVGSTDASIDVTEPLTDFSEQQVQALNGLSGFIVCAKSPSCGMERVKVYDTEGRTQRHDSVGVFTQELMKSQPLLPIEENGRLNDPVLRENFVNRVYAYHDWQQMIDSGLTANKLVQFHSRYKLLLMACEHTAYQALGRLIANLRSQRLADVAEQYIAGFMVALKKRAGRKDHTNVLMHLQGYFRRFISSQERQALAAVIENYRQGILPLMAPMTLIQHLLMKFPNDYLQQQVYLNPHPEKLALRQSL